MKVEQIYTGCLAEAAYYIESEGEVAIIDPLRESEPYIQLARNSGATIKYIFETHFHADFVSGHLDLARKTGAKIVYGPTAKPAYEIHCAEDGEEFQLGKVRIKVLHTPGHTMESSTFLLIDEAGKEHAIFTGDTLFLGDVGRPDLAVKTDLSREDLAAHLFDSLRNKIMPLPDEVIVYPGHGAGSACGKNMSKETVGSLGEQKRTNYALRADMSKEEFIKEITDGLLPPPQYFPKNAMLNKTGYASFDEVMTKGLQALPADSFATLAEDGALILDTRAPEEFHEAFIPGSLNIGLDGMFAVWVGTLIPDLNQKLIIVAPEGREEETILRLARVGYDNSLGYLLGGVNTWQQAGNTIEQIESISAETFADIAKQNKINIVDVRKPTEYASEHLVEAENYPLDYLGDHLAKMQPEGTYYLHCAGGYRSMIAASILKSKGYANVINVAGGFTEIAKTGLEKTDYVCPSTLA